MRTTMLLGLVLGLASAPALAADRYVLDPTHTYPHFQVGHLGFSTTQGRFNDTTGSLVLDRAGGASSVEVVIKAASVDTGLAKRDEHLRSPDFFHTSQFATITYKSRKVSFQGEDKATIEGDLTMLGVTQPVTLTVDRIKCGAHPMSGKQVCGFDARANLKRSDFGMTKLLPGVGDDIALRIQAEAVKQ